MSLSKKMQRALDANSAELLADGYPPLPVDKAYDLTYVPSADKAGILEGLRYLMGAYWLSEWEDEHYTYIQLGDDDVLIFNTIAQARWYVLSEYVRFDMRGQLKIEETRGRVSERARWVCEVCGTPTPEHSGQMAHIVPQRKRMISSWGADVIHSLFNLAWTCSLECNARVSVHEGSKPATNLLSLIKDELHEDAEVARKDIIDERQV